MGGYLSGRMLVNVGGSGVYGGKGGGEGVVCHFSRMLVIYIGVYE